MSSRNIESVILAINEAELASVHDLEEVEGMDDLVPIVDGLDPDEHRWYWISTSVFGIEGGYVGVRGPSGLKSESMDWDDIGCKCEAFQMEAVQTVTFIPRKKYEDPGE